VGWVGFSQARQVAWGKVLCFLVCPGELAIWHNSIGRRIPRESLDLKACSSQSVLRVGLDARADIRIESVALISCPEERESAHCLDVPFVLGVKTARALSIGRCCQGTSRNGVRQDENSPNKWGRERGKLSVGFCHAGLPTALADAGSKSTVHL
jgi:hypothetical protein